MNGSAQKQALQSRINNTLNKMNNSKNYKNDLVLCIEFLELIILKMWMII